MSLWRPRFLARGMGSAFLRCLRGLEPVSLSRSVFACVSLFFAVNSAAASRAAAQSGDYAARAQAQAERLVATHTEDPTASGTSLQVQDRVAVPNSLGDVVREAPGTQVRSTGGLGSFSSVQLRGAEGEETLVLLDEIPLMTPDGGAFDLSTFPADLFERVDVFRGGAPVWLGSGAIGGVLRLIPRKSHVARYEGLLGGGSFGTWRAEAGASAGQAEGLQVVSRAIVRGAQNDYLYLDDRGTRFDASDDIELRRKNAQFTDASGYTDVTAPLLNGRLHLLVLGNTRTGGFPGPGSQPTPNIHRNTTRALLGLSWERKFRVGQRLQLTAAFSYGHDRYTDLYGELGVSRRWSTDDSSYRGFARVADTLQLFRWLEATFVGSYALDQYAWFDKFTFPAPAPSTRHEWVGALELAARGRVGSILFELRPSLRLDWSRAQLHANRGTSGPFDATRRVLAPTARLGLGVSPWSGLALTASVATGTRLPTMYELFGDRGLVPPSPDLKPVHAVTYDAGLTLKQPDETAPLYGQLELRGFWQQRDNEIGNYRTAQYQVAHVNLSEVEQRGVEAGLLATGWDLLHLVGSATYMATQNALGKRLPLRPLWIAFLRSELRGRISGSVVSDAGVSAELNHRGSVFADRANLAVIPACTTLAVGAGLGLWRSLLHATLRVEDLTDVRCTDLIGFPLPGRTLSMSISYQEMPL